MLTASGEIFSPPKRKSHSVAKRNTMLHYATPIALKRITLKYNDL